MLSRRVCRSSISYSILLFDTYNTLNLKPGFFKVILSNFSNSIKPIKLIKFIKRIKNVRQFKGHFFSLNILTRFLMFKFFNQIFEMYFLVNCGHVSFRVVNFDSQFRWSFFCVIFWEVNFCGQFFHVKFFWVSNFDSEFFMSTFGGCFF